MALRHPANDDQQKISFDSDLTICQPREPLKTTPSKRVEAARVLTGLKQDENIDNARVQRSPTIVKTLQKVALMASIQKELISSQIPYVFPSNSPIWKTSIWVVSIGACYFLMVNISVLLFDIPNVNITAFWPLNGIYAASLLMSPRPLWKYIIAVIFLANGLGNFSLGHDWLLSSGFAVANVVEGGLIAYLYLQWNKSNNALGSFKSFFIFLGAVTFSTGIGSVLGAINLSNAFGWNLFWGFFKSWFAADTLGNCLMLAVILSWNDKHLSLVNLKPIQILGSIALAISTIGLSIVVFSQSSENGIIPLNYLVFPLLIWAALQFEVKGASLTAFIIAFIAHWFTIHGKGPFTIYGASTQDYIFWLQDYLVIMFMTAITLAIAVVERKKVEKT